MVENKNNTTIYSNIAVVITKLVAISKAFIALQQVIAVVITRPNEFTDGSTSMSIHTAGI